MTVLLVLLLCQTVFAVQATGVFLETDRLSFVGNTSNYEQLFYLVMEIAGDGQQIYNAQLQALRKLFRKQFHLDFVEEVLTRVSDVIPEEVLTGVSKAATNMLPKGFFHVVTFENVFTLYEAINVWVIEAAPYVQSFIDAFSDRILEEVHQKREHMTGAYAVISGFIKDKVNTVATVAGQNIDAIQSAGLGAANELKQYDIGMGSTFEQLLNFSAAAAKYAIKAGNYTVVLGDSVFFTAFNTTFGLVEDTIKDAVKEFRDTTMKYMLFNVGLPLYLGVIFAAGPITAPLLFGIVGASILTALIVSFIKKAIEMYFVKVVAKQSPKVYDTVKCYFSTRVGKLILLVMETMLALFIGGKLEETLTGQATKVELALFTRRVHSARVIREAAKDSDVLVDIILSLFDYLSGMVQMILFPEDDDDYEDPKDCFPKLQNLTLEDVMKFQMTLSYPDLYSEVK